MKIVRKTNFRVEVEPRRLGDYGFVITPDHMFHSPEEIEKGYLERCREIAYEIKKHVDNIDSALVKYDLDETCSHCGSDWDDDGNGGSLCCEESMSPEEKGK